jgi:hypothetical protein
MNAIQEKLQLREIDIIVNSVKIMIFARIVLTEGSMTFINFKRLNAHEGNNP